MDRFKPGEILTAAKLNEATQRGYVRGPGVTKTPSGHVVAGGQGGGGVVATGMSFAIITSKAGAVPPYLYSATEVEDNGTAAAPNWEPKVDGIILAANLKNIDEQGSGGQWVAPLNVGDVVMFLTAPGTSGVYYCNRAHYRGTY